MEFHVYKSLFSSEEDVSLDDLVTECALNKAFNEPYLIKYRKEM